MGTPVAVDTLSMHNDTPSPQTRRRIRANNPWLLLPLVALTMALAVGLGVKYRQLHQLEQAARNRLVLPTAAPGAAPGERLPDTLLTDSILSIVQSYYVDPARVENRGLLDTALAALATNPRIKTGSSSGAVWVEIDGDRRLFPLKQQPRYQDVLDVFAGLSRMLDDAGIVLAGAESPEKNAPANVSLLNATLAELDAHSALLSPEAYRELRQGTDGSFGGLGVLVGIRDNLLTVIKPLPHSPAARAGIKRKDRILGIDGTFTYGYTLDDLVEFMRGDPGTDVRLSLLRDGAHAPSTMTLKREVIHVDSVTAEDIVDHGLKVLHLTVENFASRTSREVLSAIKKFRAKNGALHGLVLDLRSNPGGLLDQAVQVADVFLRSGVIVTTRGRREEVESAGGGFGEVGFPMALLIDGDSASASEIVAGALQDQQRAVVIGQPSFGKGSVQTIFELPAERALKLTIARYYTPAGRSIQNVGIIPDLWLQPVARSPANDNLFGSYRYKNERFLRNHLVNAAAAVDVETPLRAPVRKAYYLAEPKVDGEDNAQRPDREMELALKLIGKVHAAYGDRLPEAAEKSPQWLTLARAEVDGTAARLDREATAWLRMQHHVNWVTAGAPLTVPAVELRLDDANPKEVSTGATLAIKWRLVNVQAAPVGRVSVFVRSEAPGFETKEVLVGEVPGGGSLGGTVEVAVPGNWPAGPLTLRVGAAVDAWPAPAAAAEYRVQVSQRPVAQLTATAALERRAGGPGPGTLVGREKTRLKIELANVGEVAATNLTVKIINLAGSQVQVDGALVALPALAPHEARTAFVELEAAKILYTPELAFGLYVESQDLRVPLRQRFTVKSQPNADVSAKTPAVISH